MSTVNYDCENRYMMEMLIADAQEIYNHVEFVSLAGGVLTLAYII